MTSSIKIQWGTDAVLDVSDVNSTLSTLLPSVATDLLEVAARIYFADRMSKRRVKDSATAGGDWSRLLRVTLPVANFGLWTDSAASTKLLELISWLTDDEWVLDFRQAEPSALNAGQGYLFPTFPAEPYDVALFSGGLDSAAGILLHQRTWPDRGVIAVSVSTNSRMHSVQHKVAERMAQAAGRRRLSSVYYRLNLLSSQEENSQRSRGLLFLASGASTALVSSRRNLFLFENGIGAHNLPYLKSQHGAMATRSAHPKTLMMFGDLVSTLIDDDFQVVNPWLHHTKSQMVQGLQAKDATLIALSVSCDSGFSSRTKNGTLCGHCTSCLLRRQALRAAGLTTVDSAGDYRTDVFDRSDHRPYELNAMSWQVLRMKGALASNDPWKALLDEYPELLDVPGIATSERRNALLSLYRTYCAEWDIVFAREASLASVTGQ